MTHKISKANIEKITLTPAVAGGRATDISKVVKKIYFYESIFSHHLTCNMEIIDGTDLRHSLPIVGGEMVEIDIGDKERPLKTKFKVFRISPPEMAQVDLEGYTLNLISAEYYRDASLSVTSAYKKSIHEIVDDVVKAKFTPIGSKKIAEKEETTGLHSIVATGTSPSNFLTYLCKEAESAKYPSSIFCFYETLEGYNFQTLEGMYSAEAKTTFIWDLTYTSAYNDNASEAKKLQYHIEDLQVENSPDPVRSESVHIQTHHFDPLSKSFRTSKYDSSKDIKQTSKNNPTVPRKILEKDFSEPRSARFIITDAHRTDNEWVKSKEGGNTKRRRQDFMDKERAVMQQYANIRIVITTPGDSQVKAGQTINLQIPKNTDKKDDRMTKDRLAGKYLVSSICHAIESDGTFKSTIECIRPGFDESIES